MQTPQPLVHLNIYTEEQQVCNVLFCLDYNIVFQKISWKTFSKSADIIFYNFTVTPTLYLTLLFLTFYLQEKLQLLRRQLFQLLLNRLKQPPLFLIHLKIYTGKLLVCKKYSICFSMFLLPSSSCLVCLGKILYKLFNNLMKLCIFIKNHNSWGVSYSNHCWTDKNCRYCNSWNNYHYFRLFWRFI